MNKFKLRIDNNKNIFISSLSEEVHFSCEEKNETNYLPQVLSMSTTLRDSQKIFDDTGSLQSFTSPWPGIDFSVALGAPISNL